MKGLGSAFLAGLVFGIGLLLAGMTDPGKVLGFLDIAGAWDPSLALVMVGAIAVARVGVVLARRRGTALGGQPLYLPAAGSVDRPLLLGSAVFGVGWGLAGFCPGPAVVALGFGYVPALPVVLAMLAGFLLAGRLVQGRGQVAVSSGDDEA